MADAACSSLLPRRALLGAAGAAWCCTTLPARSAEAHAPEIALRASDGHAVLSDNGPARVTYLDFWASWCTPCKLSFPWMNQMHERYAATGLRIVAINLDRRDADAQRFLRQWPPRFAVAMDPTAHSAKLYELPSLPASYLVGAGRRLLHRHRGFRLEDHAELEQRLRAALA